MLTPEQARLLVTYAVDTACSQRPVDELPALKPVRFVVWERPDGSPRQIVAVWSYLPNTNVDDDEAEELADDLLRELGVFNWRDDGVPEPTYIL